jgi:hypothetical protein
MREKERGGDERRSRHALLSLQVRERLNFKKDATFVYASFHSSSAAYIQSSPFSFLFAVLAARGEMPVGFSKHAIKRREND